MFDKLNIYKIGLWQLYRCKLNFKTDEKLKTIDALISCKDSYFLFNTSNLKEIKIIIAQG